MRTSQQFVFSDESQVGEARRAVADVCSEHQAPETDAGRLAIIMTELGRNLIRHAGGGEIVIREMGDRGAFALELLCMDRGPGLGNIGEALRDGFSTGGTAGTGLGAVRRLSDQFEIYTQPGQGTVVRSVVGPVQKDDSNYGFGGISVAVQGEEVCGDHWDVSFEPACARLILADGLGHGPFAAEAARAAVDVFRSHPRLSPGPTIDLVHLALGKTRGAAGAIITVDSVRQEVTSAGIGNISMRVIKAGYARSLVSDNGTLGGNARKCRETTVSWDMETVIVMHSDGVTSRWNLDKYPGVWNRHPSIIAALLYRDFRREKDDVTVVVLKEKT